MQHLKYSRRIIVDGFACIVYHVLLANIGLAAYIWCRHDGECGDTRKFLGKDKYQDGLDNM